MSRHLDKMPFYFRNFILLNNLWPNCFYNKNPALNVFSISSIQDDMRGHKIKKWQEIVLEYLGPDCTLTYNRATSKQILTFNNDEDLLMFKIRWST